MKMGYSIANINTFLYWVKLRRFMSDQEAWHELCNCYLAEGDYAKAVFCMEEVLLHNPHSHLVHQRLGEIRYTMGGLDNVELAKTYYLQAYKLNAKNLRVLYGLFLVCVWLLLLWIGFPYDCMELSICTVLQTHHHCQPEHARQAHRGAGAGRSASGRNSRTVG